MMPTNPSLSRLPDQAANDNGPGPRALPDFVLKTFIDLLAEVCVARLAADNDNRAATATISDGTP